MAKSFDNREGWIWMNGSFIIWKDAKSHVITQGLHYASAVFEGERAYKGKIFKSKEHTKRLFHSAYILGIDIPFSQDEINEANVVKVKVEEELKEDSFLEAKDFFRIKKDLKNEKIYHHIGIYAFTKDALTQYVNLPRSKLEVERNLEQMRAIENNMEIKVGFCDSNPLSVDTLEDLKRVEKEMS